MESYSHIELTEEETEKVLREARKTKHFKIEEIKYAEKIRKEPEYVIFEAPDLLIQASFNANGIINGNFLIDDSNRDIMELLSLYFTNNPEFEKDSRSLKKGIMLLGPLGCGKTTIMKSFAVNSHNGFVFTTCRKVCDRYANEGSDSMSDYIGLVPAYAFQNFGQTQLGRCFDDLGTESTRKHYGNELNVMAEIILARYENPSLRNRTHITANLTADQIDELYGSRVRSRLREMCNIIEFNPSTKDRRI